MQNQIRNLMVVNWKIILSIVFIIAIAAIVLGYYYLWSGESMQIPGPFKGLKKEITPPAPTGNIDDTADAVLKELVDLEKTLSGADNDPAFITTDNQEISDFGQFYNEKEF